MQGGNKKADRRLRISESREKIPRGSRKVKTIRGQRKRKKPGITWRAEEKIGEPWRHGVS